LGGLTLWRIQCTTCKAVCTVLPPFVLHYRTMRPAVARDALIATHGGLSLEWCAVLCHISPMALYRVIRAFGQRARSSTPSCTGVDSAKACEGSKWHFSPAWRTCIT
jgi:hypothetical protein